MRKVKSSVSTSGNIHVIPSRVEDEKRFDTFGQELKFGDICVRMYGADKGVYIYLRPTGGLGLGGRCVCRWNLCIRHNFKRNEIKPLDKNMKGYSVVQNTQSLLKVGSINFDKGCPEPNEAICDKAIEWLTQDNWFTLKDILPNDQTVD